MRLEWQYRRNEFNHDWLKNQYINRLDGFIELFKNAGNPGRVPSSFLTCDFTLWPDRKPEAEWLVDSFEDHMSPRGIVKKQMRGGWQDQEDCWLGDLMHEIWRFRHPVEKWTVKARRKLDAADRAYQDLSREIGIPADCTDKQIIRLLPGFQSFRDSCRVFSDALSEFPHYILTI